MVDLLCIFIGYELYRNIYNFRKDDANGWNCVILSAQPGAAFRCTAGEATVTRRLRRTERSRKVRSIENCIGGKKWFELLKF